MKQCLLLLCITLIFACNAKDKNANQEGAFFPVRSFLQSQVKHIDTSLYNLRKIEKAGSTQDTTVIPREQFRTLAADFLNIEDIGSKKWKGDYTESKMYDDLLRRAIFTYAPTTEDAPILRQDVTIEPGAGGDDAVKTIFINRISESGNRPVQKKMLWEVGKRFQVVTTTSAPGRPDASQVLEVWWGAFPSAE